MLRWTTSPIGLEYQFARDVSALLHDSPYTWYVTHGVRSFADQKVLYNRHLAGGPLAAPPGKSAHNYGLAIDVVLDGSDKPGLQMLWDTKHAGWLWLKAKVFAHPRLRHGSRFGDWPHIQSIRWHLGRYPKVTDFTGFETNKLIWSTVQQYDIDVGSIYGI